MVFDRIRENRRKYKRMPLSELINMSTNQMLTRTVLTSCATAISILPLLLFGGPNLFDFTAAIVFGIVVGTFSSIYVAAALLALSAAPAGSIDEPAGAKPRPKAEPVALLGEDEIMRVHAGAQAQARAQRRQGHAAAAQIVHADPRDQIIAALHARKALIKPLLALRL